MADTYTTPSSIAQSIRDDDDVIINSTADENMVVNASKKKGKTYEPIAIDIESVNGDVTLNFQAPAGAPNYTGFYAGEKGSLTIRAGEGKTITVNDLTDYASNSVYSNAFHNSSKEGETSSIDVMSKAVVNNAYRGALANGKATITFHEEVEINSRYNSILTASVVSGSDYVGGAVINLMKDASIRSQRWCFWAMAQGTINVNGGLNAKSTIGDLLNLEEGSKFIANGSGAYYLEGRLNIAGDSMADIVLTHDSYWIGNAAKSSTAFINLDLRDQSRWEILKNTMVNTLILQDDATLQFDLYSNQQVVVGVSDVLSLDYGTVIRLGLNFDEIDQSEEMRLFVYSGDESDYINNGFTMITKDNVVMDYEEGLNGIGWYRFANIIPEPASTTLGLLGLLVFGMRRKR